jgi:dTDP-4-amino-4,6-dideoxygalactose transaminase
MPGTNAKMNEFQALMGEMVLQHIPEIIAQRRLIYEQYRMRLAEFPGIKFPAPQLKAVEYNYAYLPVEIDEAEFGMSRNRLYEELKKYNIFARRYFYPLLSDFACYRSVSITDPLTVARGVAERILTLPIYLGLTEQEVDMICDIICEISNRVARHD